MPIDPPAPSSRDAAHDHEVNHPPPARGAALRWAELLLCGASVAAAVTIWAMGGPPEVAIAVACVVPLSDAGWRITIHIRR
ncbi:hypothetical protein ACF1AU_05460 [Streptomyces rubrogriseus]|uniref:hypothetical protein n=1 Tax=Streptomyces rubrogriseus TaxID=194673 RepID=UPI0036FA1F5F